jgi:hypothetical protein
MIPQDGFGAKHEIFAKSLFLPVDLSYKCRNGIGAVCFVAPHRGRNSTLRDSISVPQLVFLPRAAIAGSAAIFSPR